VSATGLAGGAFCGRQLRCRYSRQDASAPLFVRDHRPSAGSGVARVLSTGVAADVRDTMQPFVVPAASDTRCRILVGLARNLQQNQHRRRLHRACRERWCAARAVWLIKSRSKSSRLPRIRKGRDLKPPRVALRRHASASVSRSARTTGCRSDSASIAGVFIRARSPSVALLRRRALVSSIKRAYKSSSSLVRLRLDVDGIAGLNLRSIARGGHEQVPTDHALTTAATRPGASALP
jgi:hypothetical protein